MVKESSQDTVRLRFKKELMVIAFVVSLLALFWGGITLNSWIKFGQYRTLAAELNETLGGGYRTSYNWNCNLESTNCPSVRMIKDANFKDNEEAEQTLQNYASLLKTKDYNNPRVTYCITEDGIPVNCGLETTKNELEIKFNAKKDFIGIDIEP